MTTIAEFSRTRSSIANPTYLDWDARIHFFHDAQATSPAMVVAMPGQGSNTSAA